MTRAELVAELVEISTWASVYQTAEGADRARQIRDQLQNRSEQ